MHLRLACVFQARELSGGGALHHSTMCVAAAMAALSAEPVHARVCVKRVQRTSYALAANTKRAGALCASRGRSRIPLPGGGDGFGGLAASGAAQTCHPPLQRW